MRTVKTIGLFIILLTSINIIAQEQRGMNFKQFPNDKATTQLKRGVVRTFDYGATKVHTYETKGFFNTQCLFVEKDGKGVMIETPPMKYNYDEWIDFIVGLGYKDVDIMVSYHLIGEHFFDTKKLKFNHIYSNQAAVDYINKENFVGLKKAAGAEFDATRIKPTDLLQDGAVTINGIPFEIKTTFIGFDVLMPEIKAVHLHMLGHDCHTLIFNKEMFDNVIGEIKTYRDAGYRDFFSSHSAPETAGDATIKINYLENMKRIFSESKDGKEFTQKMQAAYPDFGWQFYLMGSAGMLYGNGMPQPEK